MRVEGNKPGQDIDYALAHGVLTGGGYAHFSKLYDKYRAGEQKSMETMNQAYKDEGWFVRMFNDPRTDWKSYSTNDDFKKVLSRLLEGAGTFESKDRAAVHDAIGEFAHRSKTFPNFSNAAQLSEQTCATAGVEAAMAIRGELEAHRPVVVLMRLDGLDWWHAAKAQDAFHVFTIVGYMYVDHKLAFTTRNSWAGRDPAVFASQACRIVEVDTVLIPGEKPTF